MRKDIKVDIETNDITFVSSHPSEHYSVDWVDTPDGLEQRYLYGEIRLPIPASDNSVRTQGLYVAIPYTPVYKEIRLCFKRAYGDMVTYMRNPVDGSVWFTVQASLYGEGRRNIYASELPLISDEGYYLVLDNGTAQVFSDVQTDFEIADANTQNKYFMLACNPGNNYRYPLTGVGLVRWVNGIDNMSDLSVTLQQEFSSDGTPVKSASYDRQSHRLAITLDTTSTD